MTPQNTVILAVLGEPPYAEFKGDVGIPYCVNQTILGGVGCLYGNADNAYLNEHQQKASLTLDF